MKWFDELAKNSSPKEPSLSSVLATSVFGSIFFLVGVLMFCSLTVSPLEKMLHAREWAQTHGQINFKQGSSQSLENMSYTYHVGGKRYQGNQLSFFSSNTDSLNHNYAPEEIVTVFYHPATPQSAVLNKGFSCIAFIDILAPFPFAIAGGSILIFGLLLKPMFQRRQILVSNDKVKLEESGAHQMIQLMNQAEHLKCKQDNENPIGEIIYSKGLNIQLLLITMIGIPLTFSFLGIFIATFMVMTYHSGYKLLAFILAASYCIFSIIFSTVLLNYRCKKLKSPPMLVSSVVDIDTEQAQISICGLNDDSLWKLHSIKLESYNSSAFSKKKIPLFEQDLSQQLKLSKPLYQKLDIHLPVRDYVWLTCLAQHPDGRIIKNTFSLVQKEQ